MYVLLTNVHDVVCHKYVILATWRMRSALFIIWRHSIGQKKRALIGQFISQQRIEKRPDLVVQLQEKNTFTLTQFTPSPSPSAGNIRNVGTLSGRQITLPRPFWQTNEVFNCYALRYVIGCLATSKQINGIAQGCPIGDPRPKCMWPSKA